MAQSDTLTRIIELIYFDFDKASSIYSQFEGGLIEQIQQQTERSNSAEAKGGIGIPLAKIGGNLATVDKAGSITIKRIHHDLFSKVEKKLSEGNFIFDINRYSEVPTNIDDDLFPAMDKFSYIKATGWSVFEDFNQIKHRVENYNTLGEFITQSMINSNDESSQAQANIEAMKQAAKKEKDRNKRKVLENEVKKVETIMNNEASEIREKLQVKEWLQEGLKNIIDEFYQDKLHVRIYPWGNESRFQIIANLKRDCFIDSTIDNTFFSYSSIPSIPLSIFGLVTNIASNSPSKFSPYENDVDSEHEIPGEIMDALFEAPMRNMFSALSNVEKLFLFGKYPSITIHPIAVYREISSVSQTQ